MAHQSAPQSWADLFTANGNGQNGSRRLRMSRQMLQDFVANAMTRAQMARGMGTDPRRNLEQECGHYQLGEAISSQTYQDLYDRDPIAARVVEVMAKESWQISPLVYDSEDPEEETEFEAAWGAVGEQLSGGTSYLQTVTGSACWEYLLRADVLSGIGPYGVILLGLDDGLDLSEPVQGMDEQHTYPTGKDKEGKPLPVPSVNGVYRFTVNAEQTTGRKLLYLRVLPETQAQVIQVEGNWTSPRFGQPVMYSITLGDPNAMSGSSVGAAASASYGVGMISVTKQVHWTRVVHIADTHHMAEPSEVFAAPRMRPGLDRILDLRKLYGPSAEMFYRGAFYGLALKTQSSLGGDVDVDVAALKDMMEEYWNGLDRSLFLSGLDAQTLSPTVSDPSNQIDKQIEAICIKIGCPIRVFKGSERGELASSQDDAAWNDRLRERQKNYITPRIIGPFVSRLIQVGVLPEPRDSKFIVWWPDLTSQTAGEKATVAGQLTGAMVQYVNSGLDAFITPMDWLTLILQRTDEEAKSLLENAADAASQEQQAEEEAKAEAGAEEPFDLEEEKARAQVTSQVVAALVQYISGGADAVITPLDLLTRFLGIPQEEAQRILETAAAAVAKEADAKAEEDMEQQMQDAEKMVGGDGRGVFAGGVDAWGATWHARPGWRATRGGGRGGGGMTTRDKYHDGLARKVLLKNVQHFASGGIDFKLFCEWFITTWGGDDEPPVGTVSLVDAVKLALAEYTSGHRTDGELRQRVGEILRDFEQAEPDVVVKMAGESGTQEAGQQ